MREAHIILKRRQEYSDCQVFQIPMLTWHQACYHATCVQRQDGKCMKMPTKRTNKRIHSCPILTFSWHSFCDLSRSFSFPSHCLHVGCYDSCFLMKRVVLKSEPVHFFDPEALGPLPAPRQWVRRPKKGRKCTRMTFVKHL